MFDNPFSNRGPVVGDHFYNCERELHNLREKVLHPLAHSVNVIAPQTSGLTSFLKHFCLSYGPKYLPNYAFRYVDLLTVNEKTDLYRELCKALGKKGEEAGIVMDGARLLPAANRLVVALDGLERLLQKPAEFDADFFSWLRSLTSAGELVLIIGTGSSLRNLNIPRDPSKVSQFGSVFAEVKLGKWSESVCRLFLNSRTAHSAYPFDADEVEFVVANINHRSPFHLQILADHLYMAKSKGYIDREKVLQAYRDELSQPKWFHALGWRIAQLGILWRITGVIASIAVFLFIVWIVFGLPRHFALLTCPASNQSERFQIALEMPKYLASGDNGVLRLTAHNMMTGTVTATILLDFAPSVQLAESDSSRIQFQDMESGERRGTVSPIRFTRIRHGAIHVTATVLTPALHTCEAMTGEAVIATGPIPYLNTLWAGLGSLGLLTLTGSITVELLKNRGGK